MLQSRSYPEEIARSWSVRRSAPKTVRMAEMPLEKAVSEYIGRMPFLWIAVPDAPCVRETEMIRVGSKTNDGALTSDLRIEGDRVLGDCAKSNQKRTLYSRLVEKRKEYRLCGLVQNSPVTSSDRPTRFGLVSAWACRLSCAN